MRPAARVQAAIELLDAIIDAAKNEGAPADRLIASYFRERRYAGSKDRRAVRALVYRAIRMCGEIPKSGRAAMLALGREDSALLDLFDGSQHGPAKVDPSEPFAASGLAPAWLAQRLARSGIAAEQQSALMERAPLDCRVNSLKADRAMLELPVPGEHLTAPQGLRFDSGTAVDQWEAYRSGALEIQDHGSQLVCQALGVGPGQTVIDLCAGAGGKTLALAAAMRNIGRLLACDTDRARLARLEPRARRAGASIAETCLLSPQRELEALEDQLAKADLVLVDAPCSGVGTWRRKPEAKWRLTEQRLDRFASLQDHLLNVAAKLVRPGGTLAFVTCSLLDAEGSDRFARFLADHSGFSGQKIDLPLGREHGTGYRLDPYHDETDGFFVAIARSS